MDEELAALAAAGAATVVTAMATDAWNVIREAVAGLFHRLEDRRRAAIEERLDGNAALVEQADDPDRARTALRGMWTLELVALLREDPDCREELARLIAEADGAPTGDQDTAAADTRNSASGGDEGTVFVQTNTVRGHATVFAVQNGDQHVRTDPGGGDDDA
jgi:hypothetical protein